jgi:flagellar hook-associated protein FlgK
MPIIFEYEEKFADEFNYTFKSFEEFINKINYKIESKVDEINYLILPK